MSDALTTAAAAALLGVSPDTLKARRRDGTLVLNQHWFKLPATRAIRYSRQALEEWRRGRSVPTTRRFRFTGTPIPTEDAVARS